MASPIEQERKIVRKLANMMKDEEDISEGVYEV